MKNRWARVLGVCAISCMVSIGVSHIWNCVLDYLDKTAERLVEADALAAAQAYG